MYESYSGLIFDMDGTILDTEPTHRQAWREVLGRYGCGFDENAMIALNGAPVWHIARHIVEQNRLDIDPAIIAREKTALIKTMLFDSVRPLPTLDVVKHRYKHRPLSVGTGSETALAESLLTHLKLRQYFEAVVGADQVLHPKPAPDTFLRCAQLMCVAPAKCVVFEDGDLGLQAAHKAGMDAIDVRLN